MGPVGIPGNQGPEGAQGDKGDKAGTFFIQFSIYFSSLVFH